MFKVNHLSVSYNGNERAVSDVSFQVTKPGIIGIIGPNGAGKSTLIKGMLNLIPHEGALTFQGQALPAFQKEIAYVEQKSAVDYTFPITVAECVSLGLYPRKKFYQRLTKKDWQKVEEALTAVSMLDYRERQIGELSGGQFQRVLIARTLVQDADLIFLDEPFVGIDVVSEEIIMHLLQEMAQAGKYIFIVHHDLSKVEEYFEQILLLNRELIAFGPTDEVFQPEKLRRAFGQQVLVLGGA
ncbi:metal ABC transporter ATP-binding protein [Enterococcus sp. LJL98]